MTIEVKDLGFAYGEHQVLKDVSFSAESGELLAVLGPNGVGKSTLFRCMLGLLQGYSGQVLIDGEAITGISAGALARRIAYVPQSHYPSFNYSVFDMVLMGTTAQVGGFSSPGEEQRELARKALQRLGVDHLGPRGYMQISGGEQQLVLIARALSQQARLIVMDEPTANLDYGNQLRVQSRVRELVAQGYTIIQSTHNPDHAFLFADRMLAMHDGRIAACGPPAQVLTAGLVQQLYGVTVQVHLSENGTRTCIPQLDLG